ncbi:MAG: right-handed parallel beta-helix repeat-containing protein [Candidatus Heimdallarchaeota archaeon]|nr:right-handed parallel beta-helix repeat-containing protein [Candidatus Heimdallarchaeota archaeon]MCK4955809.1 right-handed parallel beta-helix repeat-containing protein [Candidatus Heimdallarchaeota archaeon]
MKEDNIKTTTICLFFLLILLLSFSLSKFPVYSNSIPIAKQLDSQFNPSNFIVKSVDLPIRIENNTICGPTGYNFPGDGTEGNPYRIENKQISNNGVSGIYVRDTSVHILIQNCTIEAPTSSSIHLYELNGGSLIIRNNTLLGSASGVKARYFDAYCEIFNNTFRNNYDGVTTFYINNTLIADNTFEDNENDGIQVRSSSHCIIDNNTLSNGRFDLMIQSMSSCSVINNTFAEKGIYIDVNSQSAYNTLLIEDNWINGKEIKYLYDESNVILEDSFGQIIIAWSSNIQIRNIEFSNASFPLILDSCSDCIVENNIIRDSYCGVYIGSSDEILVTKNNIIRCEREGIRFYYDGFDNIVSYNEIIQNPIGIYAYKIGSLEVNNNNINQSDTGISITGREEFSTSLVIEKNVITHSTSQGIRLEEYTNVEIYDNSVCNNGYIGITLSDVHSSKIHYNLIQENNDYGLSIYSGSNNRIHHNSFINNHPAVDPQAYDAGISNIWYEIETNEGNYWSNYDYSGYYSIDGPSNSVDLYPNDWAEELPPPTEKTDVNLVIQLISFLSLISLCKLTSRKKSMKRGS